MAVALSATAAQATQVIANGDFSAGFADWTLFTTPLGTLGLPPDPQVTSFDVLGVPGSSASPAAELEVGDTQYNGGTEQGGGLRQTITTVAGPLNFTANVAAFAPDLSNGEGGVFSVLLDGVTLDTFTVDTINAGTVSRGVLLFNRVVTGGSHDLELLATRRFEIGPSRGDTPFQYFDNVSGLQAGTSSVPEPAAWAMMIVGFGLAGSAMRRQARVGRA
jgi:hypothetical protein